METTRRPEKTEGPSGERRTEDAGRIASAIKKHGRISLRIYGTTMLPCVQPGDVALVSEATPESIREGDLVLLRRDNHLLVRRFAEVPRAQDSVNALAGAKSANSANEAIRPEEVLGRIIRLHRRGHLVDLDSPENSSITLEDSEDAAPVSGRTPMAKLMRFFAWPERGAM